MKCKSKYFIKFSEKILHKNKQISIKEENFYLKDSINNIDDIELTIIIPAYNEEKRLDKTLRKLIQVNYFFYFILQYFENSYTYSSRKIKYEIIIIDGGSKDKTWLIIEKNINDFPNVEITGIKLRNNLGKGHTVIKGAKFSKGNFILVMDADFHGTIKEYKFFREEFDKIKYNLMPHNYLYDENEIRRFKTKPDIIIASRFQKNVIKDLKCFIRFNLLLAGLVQKIFKYC